MKRLMQDLGDLTGLDIVAAERSAPVRVAGARPGVALARGALRWLGLVAADDGRCRAGDSTGADPDGRAASRLH